MRKYFILLACLSLCGCEATKYLTLNTALYDGTEYTKVTHLLATVRIDQTCTPATVADLYAQTLELDIYSNGTPGNSLIGAIEDNILKQVDELNKHDQPVSDVYCQDKLEALRRQITSLQHSIGSKSKSS